MYVYIYIYYLIWSSFIYLQVRQTIFSQNGNEFDRIMPAWIKKAVKRLKLPIKRNATCQP